MRRRRHATDTVERLQLRTPQYHRLPNGVRVVMDHLPWASSALCGLWFAAASRDESAQHNGVAHLTEHMLAGRTRRYSVRRWASAFERLGAVLDAFTTKEHTCYTLQVLPQQLPQALRLLIGGILEPAFSWRRLRHERRVILEELAFYEDDPEEFLAEQLEQVLFGEHPLALPIAGTRHSLARIGLPEVEAFYERFYVGERAVAVLVGNLSELSLEQLQQELLRLPARREPLPVRYPPVNLPARERTLTHSAQQAYVMMGQLLVQPTPRQRFCLAVLNFLLGEGWSSRLYQRIREHHGLAYSISSEVEHFSDAAVWSITAVCSAATLPQLEQLLRQELQRMVESPPTEAEIQRATETLRTQMVSSFDSLPERMGILARSAMEGRADAMADPFVQALEYLQQLTREEIVETAAQLCVPERWSTVRLLPERLSDGVAALNR